MQSLNILYTIYLILMKIIFRLTSVLFTLGLTFIAMQFGMMAEPDEASIYHFIFFLAIGSLSQAGLWLSSTEYGKLHKLETAILMLPSSMILLFSVSDTPEVINRLSSNNRTAIISTSAYILGSMVYVLAHIQLYFTKEATRQPSYLNIGNGIRNKMDKTEQASRFNKTENASRWIFKVLLPRAGQYWFWLVLGSLFVLIYLVLRPNEAENRLRAYLKSTKPLLPVSELISGEAGKDMEYACIMTEYESSVGAFIEMNSKRFKYFETSKPELIEAKNKINKILKQHNFGSTINSNYLLFLDKQDQVWFITLTLKLPIAVAIEEGSILHNDLNHYAVSCAKFDNAAFTRFYTQPDSYSPVLSLIEINH